MIDDDAVAPADWIARHLVHYSEPGVGVVGGPADNFTPDGSEYPDRDREPVGIVRWYGRIIGNMHDHPREWRERPAQPVDHVVGNNMSLRRSAIGTFESRLKSYWQLFELDACLQAKARGFDVRFDFGNVVGHYPSTHVFAAGRSGDLAAKVDNFAHNQAFVLSKHSPLHLRAVRLGYLLLVGNSSTPGLAGWIVTATRSGHPIRELGVLRRSWRNHLAGWRAGAAARRDRTGAGRTTRGAV